MIKGEEPVPILMVEDDEGQARLIEKTIRRAGIERSIVHFRDGASALTYLFDETLREGQTPRTAPLLMLLDLNLPDMAGTDILRRVRESRAFRRVPVIVLTTTDDSREIERCYDLGCDIYITKPLNYQTFAEAIGRLGLTPP